MSVLIDVFTAGTRIAAPIGCAAVGEAVSERAGVLNVQLEGMMLVGAFGGVLGAYVSGDPWVGLVAAAASGMLLAALHGLTCIVFRAEQIVSGIALNLIALGLTSFLLPVIFGDNTESVAGFESFAVPLLHDLPVLGPVFFEQSPAVYVVYALIPLTMFILYRTRWGLEVQACGENPHGADTVGVAVARIRFAAVLYAGVLAGLGGGVLALSGLRFFVDNIAGGRGFIALAAVIFGNWKPGYVALAAWFFGCVDALQLQLQARGVPISGEFLTVLPYVATLLVLAGFVGRSRMPSQLARVYTRGAG